MTVTYKEQDEKEEPVVKKAPAKKKKKAGVVKTGTITKSKTESKSGEVIDEVQQTEQIGDPIAVSPHAMVGVGQGMTLNLGDFNSAKLYVEVSLPCSPAESDVESAYANAKGFVEKHLQEMVDGYVEGD